MLLHERPVRRKVSGGHRPARGLRVTLDRSGDLALVERRYAMPGEQPECSRGAGQCEVFADVRGATPGHKVVRETGTVLQQRNGPLPFLLDDGRNRKAAFGVLDGRREHIRKRQVAQAVMQESPARDGARHGDGVPATNGPILCRILTVLAAKVIESPRRRGGAARIQSEQLPRGGIPHDGEVIRTEAVAAWLRHCDDRCGGDRRIDRVAAALHYAQPGLGRERLAGCHDVAREDGRADGGIGIGPVEMHIGHVVEGSGEAVVPGRFRHGDRRGSAPPAC